MDDTEALTTILSILKQLEPEAQIRVLQTAHTFLRVPPSVAGNKPQVGPFTLGNSTATEGELRFSVDRTLSPKEFMRDKLPTTDVERVACLAYYLAHYRDTPHFKTNDIHLLSIEAAQPRFSNPSFSVDNAKQAGFLVPSTKGNKQMSAAGEKYVELLPDREAAKNAMKTFRPRRFKRSKNDKKPKDGTE